MMDDFDYIDEQTTQTSETSSVSHTDVADTPIVKNLELILKNLVSQLKEALYGNILRKEMILMELVK